MHERHLLSIVNLLNIFIINSTLSVWKETMKSKKKFKKLTKKKLDRRITIVLSFALIFLSNFISITYFGKKVIYYEGEIVSFLYGLILFINLVLFSTFIYGLFDLLLNYKKYLKKNGKR